jgi:hypothetical protein
MVIRAAGMLQDTQRGNINSMNIKIGNAYTILSIITDNIKRDRSLIPCYTVFTNLVKSCMRYRT